MVGQVCEVSKCCVFLSDIVLAQRHWTSLPCRGSAVNTSFLCAKSGRGYCIACVCAFRRPIFTWAYGLPDRHGLHLDAYHLAELYQDFSTLVALCNKGQVFPPEENPEAQQIKTYVELYNTKFSRELYEWYIQNGALRCKLWLHPRLTFLCTAELRVIFALDDVHKPFLEDFFSQGHRQNISWLYELTKDNLNVVPPLLLDDAHKATNLEARHLMLSIGKLAQLAVVQEQGKTLPAAKDVLDGKCCKYRLISRGSYAVLFIKPSTTSWTS